MPHDFSKLNTESFMLFSFGAFISVLCFYSFFTKSCIPELVWYFKPFEHITENEKNLWSKWIDWYIIALMNLKQL